MSTESATLWDGASPSSVTATRLEDLLDREAIRDCLIRYMRAIDRHDPELLATVYHPDGLDDHTIYIGKGVDFGPTVNAFHDTMWAAHMHYLANPIIELAGDTAHVESYYLAAMRRKDDHGADLNGGRYVDRFEKRDGEWKIAARVCIMEWSSSSDQMTAAMVAFPMGRQDDTDLSNVRPLNVTRTAASFQLGEYST
jgi:ketosteroid isomerase-like protein